MTAALRCWARRASDGMLCADEAGHLYPHGPDLDSWDDHQCAPDAGPDGRETVALRLWEISTRLDLIAFRLAQQSLHAPAMRAVAARLLESERFVTEDLATVRAGIVHGRRIQVLDAPSETLARALGETVALLSLAADILRPFAEGA